MRFQYSRVAAGKLPASAHSWECRLNERLSALDARVAKLKEQCDRLKAALEEVGSD
jgi:hypothetical protein